MSSCPASRGRKQKKCHGVPGSWEEPRAFKTAPQPAVPRGTRKVIEAEARRLRDRRSNAGMPHLIRTLRSAARQNGVAFATPWVVALSYNGGGMHVPAFRRHVAFNRG